MPATGLQDPMEGDLVTTETLAGAECLDLLRGAGQCHLALGGEEEVLILPALLSSVDAGSVTLRLAEGVDYDGTPMPDVAVYAQGSAAGGARWSVVANGEGRDVTDPLEHLAEGMAALVPSTSPLPRRRFIEVRLRALGGQRHLRLGEEQRAVPGSG